MFSLLRSLHGALVLSMVLFLFSRGFLQVLADVNSRSVPTVGSLLRNLTTVCPPSGEASNNASVVTYPQLKTMLANREVQLFDVRNPDEYQAGHIPDSVNIPLGKLEQSLNLPPEYFTQIFNVKAPEKDDDNIVFYCRSGHRSTMALNISCHLGYTRVRHFKGGYSEWSKQEGK